MTTARLAARWWPALAAVLLILGTSPAQAQAGTQPPATAGRDGRRAEIPATVAPVLRAIDETGQAPPGTLGGRPYENQARRGEQPLPRVDREGDPIAYRTWDVRPEARGRGAERIVTGSDGSAYYTPDDFRTFATIRNPARSHLGGTDHAPHPAAEPPARPGTPPGPADGRPMGKGDGVRPHAHASDRNAPARPADRPIVALEPRVAARVNPVLEQILAHDAPPPETVGGREYRNLGLEDGEVLPRTDPRGRPIRYREWDVNRKVPGRNRGAERIVTGSDGRAYYTDDHYATFRRIR